jgi:TonB family protein
LPHPMTESSPANVLDTITPERETRWFDPEGQRDRRAVAALAVALAAHLLVAWILAGGASMLLAAMFGVSAGKAHPKPIGDKAGVVDGIAAEVIDAAEFDKRYISYKAGRDRADNEARPAAPPPKSAPPETTASIEKPVPDAPGEVADPSSRKAQARKPAAREAFTEAEIEELLAASIEEITGGVSAIAAPGQARLGEASPFVRGVLRILKRSMPRKVSAKGVVVVHFLVGDTGAVEAIRIVRSSGHPGLDRAIVDSVRATRLTPPPPNTPPRERMFQIAYDYH